jgi:hypothetical protein
MTPKEFFWRAKHAQNQVDHDYRVALEAADHSGLYSLSAFGGNKDLKSLSARERFPRLFAGNDKPKSQIDIKDDYTKAASMLKPLSREFELVKELANGKEYEFRKRRLIGKLKANQKRRTEFDDLNIKETLTALENMNG